MKKIIRLRIEVLKDSGSIYCVFCILPLLLIYVFVYTVFNKANIYYSFEYGVIISIILTLIMGLLFGIINNKGNKNILTSSLPCSKRKYILSNYLISSTCRFIIITVVMALRIYIILIKGKYKSIDLEYGIFTSIVVFLLSDIIVQAKILIKRKLPIIIIFLAYEGILYLISINQVQNYFGSSAFVAYINILLALFWLFIQYFSYRLLIKIKG